MQKECRVSHKEKIQRRNVLTNLSSASGFIENLYATNFISQNLNAMKQDHINQNNILEIAALRFKTVVAEAAGNQKVTLQLPVDSGVQGFIVLLQPPLPSIN